MDDNTIARIVAIIVRGSGRVTIEMKIPDRPETGPIIGMNNNDKSKAEEILL